MAGDEIKEIMGNAFVDLKIDSDRMEGGDELLKQCCKGENGGIPWFVFVDPTTGEGIVNSTGPGGNCGFPYTEEEIAWFGKMLESADEWLSADARSKLTESLRANRERTEAVQAQPEAEVRKAKPEEDEAVTDDEDQDEGNG